MQMGWKAERWSFKLSGCQTNGTSCHVSDGQTFRFSRFLAHFQSCVRVCVCVSAHVTEWVPACQELSISDDTCHLQLRLKATPCHESDRFSLQSVGRTPSKTHPPQRSEKKTRVCFHSLNGTIPKPSS